MSTGSVAVIAEPVTREQLLALQEAAKELPNQIDPNENLWHHFAPGLYARELWIPADSFVVGKIHKHEHLAMLVYGTASIADEFDNVKMSGPCLFKSKAGVKRALYTHEDCLFITFHPTELTDLEAIEEHVIAPSYEAYEAFTKLLEKQQ
jgi:hypothetical protein